MGLECLPIEKTVELNLNFPSVSERYYSHHYFVPKNSKKKTFVKPKNSASSLKSVDNKFSKEENAETEVVNWLPNGKDTCIMIHSNRICVVCIPPNHPITKYRKTVTKVDFCVDGFDRLANKVSGKGKRGAQWSVCFHLFVKFTVKTIQLTQYLLEFEEN
ncbi:Protein Simiate [Armadillidium nasatum]|uniref:Protein Simiate n=1 Tax=Armadillidium nasatum TaxID=96803 RepID=A0A5N5SRG7_9CRUS|nr:Protein Simiate [Armadillidium nasatum]